MPNIHHADRVEEWFRDRRVNPQQLRRLRNEFYKKNSGANAALETLDADLRAAARDELEFHALTLESRHDSTSDGATKLVFRTRAGLLLESVILRIASGRSTVCVSTQVGCAAKCAFCATGAMGMAVDLTLEEILDQVIQASGLLTAERRRLRNVVFMGMGEPFHNESELHAALDVLRSPRCFDLSERHLLVSTVGVPDAMRRYAERYPRMRLALSLHAARPEVRERLVPLTRRHSLDELRRAVAFVNEVQRSRVMIEYLMLDGINDGDADLDALRSYVDGLDVMINLIPYNSVDGTPGFRATSRDRREAFGEALRAGGLQVTHRYSLGSDVAAACGQLVRPESRSILRRSGFPGA
ncbi:MAG: 23S rRNA (adenine(2503)-C(2))-methyltransferase RlmN [bacterium]|nr:23S rRNA (adenine(2503)-C(2))-methyltransferase RlmN [bacterium]